MQAKRILVTGTRAPVGLELCRSFAQAGHTVFAAESQWPHLGLKSRAVSQSFELPKPRLEPLKFARALEQLVQSERIDLVIPTCEEVFYVASAAGLSGHPERYFVSSRSVLRSLHDKWAFVQLAQSLGLQVPQTWRLQGPQDLKQLPPRKLILKPVFSRFASQTLLKAGESIPELPLSEAAPWLAQDFIEGRELCSYSVAKAGKLTAHVVYYPKWRAKWGAGFGAGIYFESVENAAVLQFVQTVVKHLNFTGQIAFDFIENDQGLWALECNPRAVSGVHLLSREAQVQAFLGNGFQPSQPGGRVKLGLAMAMYGLPAALGQGRVGEWWRDWQRAKDAIWDSADPHPGWHQLVCVASSLRQASRNKVSVLQATTLDIEWNGEEPGTLGPSAKAEILSGAQIPDPVLRELSQIQPSRLVANLQTGLRAVAQGELVLPISLQSSEVGNSFIASAYTHYVSYAIEELRELDNPLLQGSLGLLLGVLGRWLKLTQIDELVYVNNWLLTTCLYPPLSLFNIQATTKALQAAFPGKAIVWRSVHAYRGDSLKRALVECGYRLIPSRSVLFYDAPRGDHHHKKDFKHDLKLLQQSPYRLRKLTQPTQAELERVQGLYTALYIQKYSPFNPQYTAAFMDFAARSGLLELYVLEDAKDVQQNGRIDGVMGLYCRGGYMAAPVFGYDTALPQELGLYRLLSTYLTLEAERRGLILHASSGVARFKRSRGATPEIEWIAVNDQHLPLHRRMGWGTLEFLMGEIAVPLIRRMQL